jgi:hypothetical protein
MNSHLKWYWENNIEYDAYLYMMDAEDVLEPVSAEVYDATMKMFDEANQLDVAV